MLSPWLTAFCVLLLAVSLAAPQCARAAASTLAEPASKPSAAAPGTPASGASKSAPGSDIAQMISTVTGIAISPLLGVSAVGCWQYVSADSKARSNLPWYAHPWFFIPSLATVGLIAAKDVLGAATPPGLKKPIDIAETLENKVSGLVATGALLPLIGSFLGGSSGSASLGGTDAFFAAVNGSTFLEIAAAPFMLAAYAVVWMTAHSIHVMILLSPWGAVDAVLKGARTAVLSLLTGISMIKPAWGAVLSVLLIIISYFIAGWSFRLTVQGWIYCWDFLTGRSHRFEPSREENWSFAGRQIGKAPIRSYGRLVRTGTGALEFRYRPWLFMAEQVEVIPSDRLAVGVAVLHPTLEQGGEENSETLLNFPPRYRGHEAALAQVYSLKTREIGILRGLSALKNGLKALFGMSPRTS